MERGCGFGRMTAQTAVTLGLSTVEMERIKSKTREGQINESWI